MLQSSIIVSLLGCCLLPSGVMTFGVESALPIMQDLQAHLPLVHPPNFSVLSSLSTHTSPHTGIIDMSDSISSITPANNLLASSNLDITAKAGDSTTAITDGASALLNDYKNALTADPLRVKIITGCLLAIVGDAIAQLGQPEDYNTKRASAFVVFDGVWRTIQQVTYGPIILTCNGRFSTNLLGSLPFANIQDQLLEEENRMLLGAIEQTLVSQLVLIPLLYYPIFYAVTGIVQSLTLEEIITRAKETFVTLMKRNLLFWIPVQFCAFYFVEENLQIPVLTACGLIWTVILSLSAGNVNTSSVEEEENAIVVGSVEEKMVSEVGLTQGAIGLPNSSFFYGSGVKVDDESSEDNTAGSSTAQEKSTENKVGEVRK